MAAACLVFGAQASAQQQQQLTFIGVALDKDTQTADRKLTDYLSRTADVRFALEDLEYERVIDRLVTWRTSDGFFLARTTPYAYVVSELLGADVEPLATYVSATTGQTTYHSYFVVNRKDFSTQPTLLDVLRFLGERKQRARFVYHSQFSTSSYFLPSLFFRSHKIFHMSDESTESLVPISADRIPENSSSKLVELVASGQADLAAIWDGTKTLSESPDTPSSDAPAKRVYFIELPTALPNDLLVTSASLDSQMKERLRAAVRAMKPKEINIGDFQTWQGIIDATEARLALGNLRQAARERVAPVTVDVQLKTGAPQEAASRLVDAARQAVRLSGTEFVVFDPDFHEHIDFRWTLEPIHDGAVVLESTIPGFDLDAQEFRLSFRDTEDLTRRLVSIVESRIHRIRYVWPFSVSAPIVIRDSGFSLPIDTAVIVQRITWLDPERNSYRAGEVFLSRIRGSNFYRYELDRDDFVKRAMTLDPLSNSSYRVILTRPAEERLIFRVLTVALLSLFVLAAIAAAWDLVIAPRSRRTAGTVSFHEG